MGVLSTCISLYHMWYPLTPEESVLSFRTRVTGHCKPGSNRNQAWVLWKPVLLTTEQSLRSLFHFLATQQRYCGKTHTACSTFTIHNLVGFSLFIDLYPVMIQVQPAFSCWVLAPSLRVSLSSPLASHFSHPQMSGMILGLDQEVFFTDEILRFNQFL